MRQLRTAVMAAVVACLPVIGHAAQFCSPLPAMEAYLAKGGYQLSMVTEGDEALGMFFINPTGDWVELAVSKSGVACVVQLDPVAQPDKNANHDSAWYLGDKSGTRI